MIHRTCTTRETISGTVLIIGDSITNDGRYVSFLTAYLRLYDQDSGIVIHNLGVSSETLSGLSEPDHPFPRPCVFGRLTRIIERIKPDWVIASYGINDGIYYPLSADRFEAYQNGVRKLSDAVHEAGAKLVVLTPPPFDADSFSKGGGELLNSGADKYSYMQPYYDYNSVMKHYGEYLKKEEKVDQVIDIYSALLEVRIQLAAKNPQEVSGDGIHPDLHGHLTIAVKILKELFGMSDTRFEQVMEEDYFKLFEMIYQRDLLLHVSVIESIGHDNVNKQEYLTGNELDTEVFRKDEEINSYIQKNLYQFYNNTSGDILK